MHSKQIARHLLEIEAVKLDTYNPFTWASGISSPIYCDNRIALSYPKVRSFIKIALADATVSFGAFDVVAGVATAGIAHGALLADRLAKPFVYVRSSAKEHGRKNLIEGEIKAGAKVLVIEDLISTGGSCVKVIDALRDAGCEVVGVLAIFQYGFDKAKTVFENIGVPLKTLCSYDILLEEAIKSGYIQANELTTLQKWRENPEGWSALITVDG
jgi:orotate phosphoribosyltransferase